VARQAELEEFSEFVVGVQATMVRLAELLTGDRDRAEDLAQEGFARAFASWRRVRTDPAAYVRRCIVNANTDWWRRRTWRERPHSAVPDRPDPADSTEQAVVTRDAVLRALSKLTARERAVLALRYYMDLSEIQISAELGIARGTVKSTVARALGKLRADAELRSEATP
jgi:RNA polymerase sigma-70 factor (sigma-E family)